MTRTFFICLEWLNIKQLMSNMWPKRCMVYYRVYFKPLFPPQILQSVNCGPILLSSLVLSCIQPSSLQGLTARRANSFHLFLSSTLLSKSTVGRFFHVAMLFIHIMSCPSLLLDPGNVPCMTSLSRLSPCFCMTWPEYDYFHHRAVVSDSLFTPAFSKRPIHLFICFLL